MKEPLRPGCIIIDWRMRVEFTLGHNYFTFHLEPFSRVVTSEKNKKKVQQTSPLEVGGPGRYFL